MSDHVTMSAPGTLELRRTLPGSIDRVWAFLTQDELRRKWMCAGEVEPRAGGRIVFDFDHSRLCDTPPPEKYRDQAAVRFEGEIVEYDPPKRLVFLWPEDEAGTTHTRVSITLKAVGEETELHLIHEKLDKPDLRAGAAAGWHAHTDLLEDLLRETPVRDFWVRHTELEADYEKRLA